MNEMAAPISLHKDDRRAVVTRVEGCDGRGGSLAAACQLAFTVVTPRSR